MNALQFTSIDIKILICFITSELVEKVLFNQQNYSAAKIVWDQSYRESGILLWKLAQRASNAWCTDVYIINRDCLVQKEIEDYLDCLVILVSLERWGFLDHQDMDHKE